MADDSSDDDMFAVRPSRAATAATSSRSGREVKPAERFKPEAAKPQAARSALASLASCEFLQKVLARPARAQRPPCFWWVRRRRNESPGLVGCRRRGRARVPAQE
jgi:hypothetical protein